MTTIKAYIREIEEIDKELTNLKKSTIKLRDQKKHLEREIQKYMEDTSTNGFKCGKTAVLMEKKTRRKPKGKKKKLEDINTILKSSGIYNEELAKKILLETRGIPEEKNNIKIIN